MNKRGGDADEEEAGDVFLKMAASWFSFWKRVTWAFGDVGKAEHDEGTIQLMSSSAAGW